MASGTMLNFLLSLYKRLQWKTSDTVLLGRRLEREVWYQIRYHLRAIDRVPNDGRFVMLKLALFDDSSDMAGNWACVAWTATYRCLSRTSASSAIDSWI